MNNKLAIGIFIMSLILVLGLVIYTYFKFQELNQLKQNTQRILDKTVHFIHTDDLTDVLPRTQIGQHILQQQEYTLQSLSELQQNINVIKNKLGIIKNNNSGNRNNTNVNFNSNKDNKNNKDDNNKNNHKDDNNKNNSNYIPNYTVFKERHSKINTYLEPQQQNLTPSTSTMSHINNTDKPVITTTILANNHMLNATMMSTIEQEKEKQLEEYLQTSYQPLTKNLKVAKHSSYSDSGTETESPSLQPQRHNLKFNFAQDVEK